MDLLYRLLMLTHTLKLVRKVEKRKQSCGFYRCRGCGSMSCIVVGFDHFVEEKKFQRAK